MTKRRKTPEELRSQRWFAAPGRAGPHKYWRMAQAGFTAEDHHRKPVIGIINPWSDFNSDYAY